MLGIVLDILTVLFLLLLLKKCSSRTKLRNVVESIGYVLSTFVAVPIAVFLGDFCYSSFYRPVVIERVRSLVETSGDVDPSVDPLERIMNGMPMVVNNGARMYHTTSGKSLAQINWLLSGDLSASSTTGDIVDLLARPVVDGVLRALFFVVVLAGCYRLLRAFYPTVEAYFYNPDRAAVSPTIGMVLGAGKVLVIFLSLLSVLSLAGAVLPDYYLFRDSTYSHSFLFRLFYEDNLIMLFLGKGLSMFA
ncbi:MAG: hypothetical protein IIU00_03830 [Clostridia bacterium]|nr:hypothetical protein [Clostridia bacterium]